MQPGALICCLCFSLSLFRSFAAPKCNPALWAKQDPWSCTLSFNVGVLLSSVTGVASLNLELNAIRYKHSLHEFIVYKQDRGINSVDSDLKFEKTFRMRETYRSSRRWLWRLFCYWMWCCVVRQIVCLWRFRGTCFLHLQGSKLEAAGSSFW
jgi:hypothetical protein